MALIRWEPTRELDSLQTEMNRLFSSFFEPGESGGAPRRWAPPMDLIESEEHYVLTADLPGMSQQDIAIEFEDGVLSISGERPVHEGEGLLRRERAAGAFRRTLSLPEGVDPDGVQAAYENGVLEVRIPKPEQRKPRKVAISIADSPPASTIEAGVTHSANGANAHEPALASP